LPTNLLASAAEVNSIANSFVGMLLTVQSVHERENKMLKSFRFNPGFQTDKQAVENFVVRQSELKKILDCLSSSDPDQQRILVLAPRGAGKTTLCRRVLAELRGSRFLQKRWIPIFHGEESYAITTPGEFLLECLSHLANDSLNPIARGQYDHALQLGGESELKAYCTDVFRTLTVETGKRFLVIIENLHMILNEQIGHDGAELVDLICDPMLFGVLATSVKSDDDSVQHNLLHSFMHLPLKPLSLDECHELWTALTDQAVDRSRVRPLQILTGGSPRLIHVLADFMNTPSLQDLMENLNFLIDENTEYFKSQLDTLPGQERKVFVALLEAWDPSSAKQIADVARVNVNTASAMLNRLAERGAVVKQPGPGRSTLYHAAERLFNIYYLMRRRSHPSNRVRALVAFMTQYYDRDELVDTTAMLAAEACKVEPTRRSDYHNAFDAILKEQPEAIRTEILRRTPADFLNSLQIDPAVRYYNEVAQGKKRGKSQFKTLLAQSKKLVDNGDHEKGRAALMQAIALEPTRFEPWIALAFLHLRLDENDSAIVAAREAVEKAPKKPVTYTVLGIMLGHDDQHTAAADAFSKAIGLDPEDQLAIIELAKIRHDEGEHEIAIELFQRAADLGDLSDEAASRFGYLLFRHGQPVRAEDILKNAVHATDNDVARRTLVHILVEQDRAEDAEHLLREAAESSEEWERWVNYGSFVLRVRNDASSAKKIAESALARGVNGAAIYRLLARSLHALGKPAEELERIADKLLAELGETEEAFIESGQIFQMIESYDRAEAAFRAAGKSSRAGSYPWLLLGRLLLRRPNKADEAEQALRQAIAIESDDPNCGPLKELAEFRIHRGDDVEAIGLLEKALASNDSCECSLVLRADIAARNGDREKAKQLLDQTLVLNPESVPALTTLARISDEQNAEELIGRAHESEPGDPRVLLARSRLNSRDLNDRLADASKALSQDSELTEAHIELAILLTNRGEREAALEHLAEALRAIPSRMEIIPAFVNASLHLVSKGFLDDVSALLTGDQGRPVEPLAVALQIFRGEKPVVAKEIEEVAHDILGQLSKIGTKKE
jgi:Tfp pilus assembly protein PilF